MPLSVGRREWGTAFDVIERRDAPASDMRVGMGKQQQGSAEMNHSRRHALALAITTALVAMAPIYLTGCGGGGSGVKSGSTTRPPVTPGGGGTPGTPGTPGTGGTGDTGGTGGTDGTGGTGGTGGGGGTPGTSYDPAYNHLIPT